MFKFFKEMVDSFKEGIAEGKEELKQEAAEKEQKEAANQETAQNEIDAIDFDEKFGTALGAPFRVVIFGDWFTLFGSNDNDPTIPLHLYTFGTYPNKEKFVEELSKSINRDFDINDKESCKDILASYFKIAGINQDNTLLQDKTSNKVDATMWDITKEGSKALICAVVSHIISASVDVGYLTKNEALPLLQNINMFAKQNYSNWQNYSDAFLTGDKNIGLNNSMGRSVLSKYIKHLNTKKGSPWNNISW